MRNRLALRSVFAAAVAVVAGACGSPTVTPPVVGNEDGPVTTTMKLTSANLEKMLAGSLDPTLAYMTGKLKVEGSLGVAMKLSGMLGD